VKTSLRVALGWSNRVGADGALLGQDGTSAAVIGLGVDAFGTPIGTGSGLILTPESLAALSARFGADVDGDQPRSRPPQRDERVGSIRAGNGGSTSPASRSWPASGVLTHIDAGSFAHEHPETAG
jgi:hypothetical protein